MESKSGMFSISKPPGYQALVDYWTNGGTAPDASTAFDVMMQLAANVRLENVRRNVGALDALVGPMRRDNCEEGYAVVLDASAETLIPASDYCNMFGIGSAWTSDNGGWNVGWLDPNDWMAYNINPSVTGLYTIEYRVASPEGLGGFQLEASNGKILGKVGNCSITHC